jgi:hypothetical protein
MTTTIARAEIHRRDPAMSTEPRTAIGPGGSRAGSSPSPIRPGRIGPASA